MAQCKSCYYNREMVANGVKITACYYRLETGRPLYGRADDPEYCSGYDPADNAGGGKSEKIF